MTTSNIFVPRIFLAILQQNQPEILEISFRGENIACAQRQSENGVTFTRDYDVTTVTENSCLGHCPH